MNALHLTEKVRTPPLKCQGIKTRLVPFISESISWKATGTWVEPFSGSAVVALNLRPKRARLYDVNPHIINVYNGIRNGSISPQSIGAHLETEGARLHDSNGEYYYEVRDRFNEFGDARDYVFLNRSCFNGLVRFNLKGKFNVPFCRKPDRFRKAYITKITNQVAWVQRQISDRDWHWIHGDWRDALASAEPADFVYMDPPYIGRNAGYFSQWGASEAETLAKETRKLPCHFAVSMWLKNKYRTNLHVEEYWHWARLVTTEHFYHLGSTTNLRNPMVEALLLST